MSSHPGQILRESFLAPLGIHPSGLARACGVDRSTISRLLAGKQPITPTMAARLGAYFRVPPRWFLLMQAEFDAADIAGCSDLVVGVTPMLPNPDVLLTPAGVIHLDAVASPHDPGTPRGVHTVAYNNGAVVLTSGES